VLREGTDQRETEKGATELQIQEEEATVEQTIESSYRWQARGILKSERPFVAKEGTYTEPSFREI